MNPLSNEQVFNLYVKLRPRNHEFERCVKSVTSVLSAYPDADVSLAGLGKDAHQSHITFHLIIKNPSVASNRSLSTLAFANAIFTQLFDYLPCYTTEPTEHEKLFALNFSGRTVQNSVRVETKIIREDVSI